MQALILEQQDGKTLSSVQNIDANLLPPGDVTVDIHWSSLNYKDALAITGKGKIIRNFPMIPGIDFAGIVHASEDPRFHVGQQVLLTGWGVGENHWGGLAERARVKGEWLVAMPEGLDGRKAMAIGTAGFTAMLCVMALEDAGMRPQDGEIVVTGASGGVGSTAVALLHHLGYQVAAVSGRESTHDYLKSLGAQRILGRDEFAESRPLEKQIWAGAIDTVGDKVLAKVLAQMNYGGCVAACGRFRAADHRDAVYPAQRTPAGRRFGNDPARAPRRSLAPAGARSAGVFLRAKRDRNHPGRCPGLRRQNHEQPDPGAYAGQNRLICNFS